MKLLRRLRDWLRPKMPVVNIGLALGCYIGNEFFFQVFCQPVRWAAVTLIACTGAFLVWPWLNQLFTKWRYSALFFQGGMLPICLYCMWFFGGGTYVGSIFYALMFWLLLTPLLVWVPVLFAWQLLRRAWNAQLPLAVVVFGLGALVPLLAQVWAEYQFREVEAAVAQLPPGQRQDITALVKVVPRTYMAERLAGTQFKYHNYFCLYDGTRPALHDPLVNVCLWLRSGSNIMSRNQLAIFRSNPLYLTPAFLSGSRTSVGQVLSYADVLAEQQADVNHQATLYHRLFPDRPLNAGCNCTPGHGTITVQAE